MMQIRLKFTNGEETIFEARNPDDISRRLEEIRTAKVKACIPEAERHKQKLLEELEKIQSQSESAP